MLDVPDDPDDLLLPARIAVMSAQSTLTLPATGQLERKAALYFACDKATMLLSHAVVNAR
jgi:hypothetical protein